LVPRSLDLRIICPRDGAIVFGDLIGKLDMLPVPVTNAVAMVVMT
jgi:hypothetical protein